MTPTRALIVIRLSRLTDESTSPERQRIECEKFCVGKGWEIISHAEDFVSAGKSSPFDRSQLGSWLDRPQEYDTIVFYRLDRIVRKMTDLSDLIRWSEDHDVNLVSATETHFDLSTQFGKVIAQLVASFAEMELEGIRERTASSYHHLQRGGKWTGGVPPWGYLPKQDDNGDWRLVQDPVTVPLIHSIVERVLDGETATRIAESLNRTGPEGNRLHLTQKDRFAQHQGRDVRGYKWHSAGLKRSLSNPTLLGHVVVREPILDSQGRAKRAKNGDRLLGEETVLRNDDGSPVVRAEPILTREVFDRLQKELQGRENRKEPTKRTTSLLLGVVYCAACGLPAYKLQGGKGRSPRYRCRSVQDGQPCSPFPSVTVPYMDEAVTRILLGLLGESERLARVWDAGEDTSGELAEVNASLTDLAGLLLSPTYRPGTPQRAVLDKNIEDLEARRSELASVTSRAAGWVWQPTGDTFADWWGDQDLHAQNMYLRSMGVTAGFIYPMEKARGTKPQVFIELGDLGSMVEQLDPQGAVRGLQEKFTEMERNQIRGLDVKGGTVTEYRK